MSKKAQIIWIRKLISVSLLVGFIFICTELSFDQGAEKNHTTVRISDFTDQKTKQISLQKITPLPVAEENNFLWRMVPNGLQRTFLRTQCLKNFKYG